MSSLLGYKRINIKIIDLPLLSPISRRVLAGVTETINFPSLFGGFATDLQLINEDNAAVALYQIDGPTQALLSLAGDRVRSFGSQQISQVLITAAIGGAVGVTANVIKFPAFQEP